MSITKSVHLAVFAFITTLGLAVTLLTVSVSAQETGNEGITPLTTSEEAPTTESTETTEVSTEEANPSSFSYVAQPGDSYSLMARKAIQTYGINNSVNLSGAQILYVETNLTLLVGSPVLTLGEKVDIAESTVSDWVKKAQEMNNEQKAAWEVYVKFADFNTNSVGQPQE